MNGAPDRVDAQGVANRPRIRVEQKTEELALHHARAELQIARLKGLREAVGLQTDLVKHQREEEGLRSDRLERRRKEVRLVLEVLGIPAAVVAFLLGLLKLLGQL